MKALQGHSYTSVWRLDACRLLCKQRMTRHCSWQVMIQSVKDKRFLSVFRVHPRSGFVKHQLWLLALLYYWCAARQQCDPSCHTPPEVARAIFSLSFFFTKWWCIIQHDQRLCARWLFPMTLILYIYRRLAPIVNSLMHVNFISHVSSSSSPPPVFPLSIHLSPLIFSLFTCSWHHFSLAPSDRVCRCVVSYINRGSYCTL